MFRFEHPYILWSLVAVPVFVLAHLLYKAWQRRKRQAAFDQALFEKMAPRYSHAKSNLKFILFLVAFTALVFAAANPQFGSKLEEVKRKGVDIMIALDISNSMMAEDLSPNRLERAKRAIQELYTKVVSDRIGIVVFAGEAFVQLPITTDYSAAKLFLETINPNLIATQGTDIGNAISLCLESFDPESPASKAIIILTDGENHESGAESVIEEAQEMGVNVYTIGMGSENGAPIPIYASGKKVGFRQDQEGSTVVSKLNEQMLAQIAQEGNGIYVRSTDGQSGIKFVLEEINSLEKVEYGSKIYTDFEDRYQYLLFPALLLLIIELIIPNTKSRWWQKLFAS